MRIHPTSILFVLFIAAVGCESVALMPRPDIDERDVGRDKISRDSDSERAERGREIARQEVTGTVQRVDRARQEIELRTANRNISTLRYDSRTVVYDRDRTVAVEELREGDEVAVQPGTGAGNDQFADIIRMLDRRSQLEY